MFLGLPNRRDGPDISQDPQLPKTRSLCEVPNNKKAFLSFFFLGFFFFYVDDFIIFIEFGGSDSKESACNAGDLGSVPELGEGNGNPLQYSGLENPMDRGAWWATVHGVAELDMTEQLALLLSFFLNSNFIKIIALINN